MIKIGGECEMSGTPGVYACVYVHVYVCRVVARSRLEEKKCEMSGMSGGCVCVYVYHTGVCIPTCIHIYTGY